MDEPLIKLRQYEFRDEITIPRRPWLMRGLLMRGHIAALIAAGGVGKSMLALTIALHLCAGRSFGPWKCTQKCRVAVLSVEEDEAELDRRLHALRRHYGFAQEDAFRLFIVDVVNAPILAAADAKGRVQATKMAKELELLSESAEIDVWIVDPMIEVIAVPENDNNAVRSAVALIRFAARRLRAAVLLMHHTKKGSTSPGDVDASRGASSLIGLVRTAHTLVPMTAIEAGAFGLDEDEAASIFRCDDGKQNYAPRRAAAYWFKFRSLTLANADEHSGKEGDDVGVPVRWVARSLLSEKSFPEINRVLRLIDEGLPNGDKYGETRRGGSKRWVGLVLIDEWEATEEQAHEIISNWLKSKLLTPCQFEASKGRGKRDGLRVDWTRKPGEEEEL